MDGDPHHLRSDYIIRSAPPPEIDTHGDPHRSLPPLQLTASDVWRRERGREGEREERRGGGGGPLINKFWGSFGQQVTTVRTTRQTGHTLIQLSAAVEIGLSCQPVWKQDTW
ncbi:unnamed protein product [Pleuronectes platessa]|uniref:Uncharacterized protein n=1 Tax=Pleuronectes platessa TaxID=8262 RepID=A0A9N7TJI1_PLEPL|nr:unnamed protein product [Pleuronectes platessa]